MYYTVEGDETGDENPLIPKVVGADDVKFPFTLKELLDRIVHEPLKSLNVLHNSPPLLIVK